MTQIEANWGVEAQMRIWVSRVRWGIYPIRNICFLGLRPWPYSHFLHPCLYHWMALKERTLKNIICKNIHGHVFTVDIETTDIRYRAPVTLNIKWVYYVYLSKLTGIWFWEKGVLQVPLLPRILCSSSWELIFGLYIHLLHQTYLRVR